MEVRKKTSGLYNDLYTQEKDYYHVRNNFILEATSASNNLCFPTHKICTDVNGIVTDVTKGFLHFTGYERDYMVGRKCNFLQGKDTNLADVSELRLAIEQKQESCVVILNYCKDGNPFWNILTIIPQYSQGILISFTSSIVGLPVPSTMKENPKLCLKDAISFINVFSAVPSSIPSQNISYISKDPSKVFKYKHKNYSKWKSTSKKNEKKKNLIFIAETNLPTNKGNFRLRAYRSNNGAEPLALIESNLKNKFNVLVRVHDQCVTSEVFGSLKCDCKQQLDTGLEKIKENKTGILFYLPQEGRGIGIANKVAAYSLQESGFDTVDANRELGLPDDAREYDCVKYMLDDLGIKSIQLMTNNPRKIEKLKELGIIITKRVKCICKPNSEDSLKYIKTKALRMGHLIN